ncbi:MAG: hypothetical protein AAFP89_04325 [Bacteroidota bacterium]
MDSTITTQNQLASVKQFNCTNCGAAHRVMSPRAQYLACNYCGSVLDTRSEEYEILQQLGNPEKHQPFSFIRLGQKANFDGKEYQVIARTRWRMRYKEYYHEEGEQGYSNEVWIYDEWLMIDNNYTYFYLVEDKEGYKISEEIIPEVPMLLTRERRMNFFQKQSPKIVREYGQANVVFFEGESNYTIKKGDEIRFAAFKDRGIEYSAEWRMDGEEISEIEFFQEVPISRRKVLEAFNNNEEIEKLKQKAESWKFIFQAAAVAGMIMLSFTLYSLFSSGSEVYSSSFSISSFQPDIGQDTGPIEITSQGNYQLNLKADKLSNGMEFYALAFLMDKDSTVINQVSSDFYYSTGYDGGEKWTEKNMDQHIRFRVETPGTYFARVYVQMDRPNPTGSLAISLNEGIMMTRYYAFALIIFIVIALIARNNAQV